VELPAIDAECTHWGSVQKWRDLVHTLPCGLQALYSTQTTAYTACLVGTPGGDSLDNSRPVIHELYSMQDKAVATVLIVYHIRYTIAEVKSLLTTSNNAHFDLARGSRLSLDTSIHAKVRSIQALGAGTTRVLPLHTAGVRVALATGELFSY